MNACPLDVYAPEKYLVKGPRLVDKNENIQVQRNVVDFKIGKMRLWDKVYCI